MRTALLFAFCFAILMSPGSGFARAAEATYGVDDLHYYVISALDFYTSEADGVENRGNLLWPKGEGIALTASVHLPDGAVWVETKISACHGAGKNLYVTDESYGPPEEPLRYPGGLYIIGGVSQECGEYTVGVRPGTTNRRFTYSIIIWTDPPYDGTNSIHAVRIGYRLQVSPPPAAASFTDVPESQPFFQYVEAMKAAGITQGCGGGRFCPDAPLSRAQAAAFFSRALGLYWP